MTVPGSPALRGYAASLECSFAGRPTGSAFGPLGDLKTTLLYIPRYLLQDKLQTLSLAVSNIHSSMCLPKPALCADSGTPEQTGKGKLLISGDRLQGCTLFLSMRTKTTLGRILPTSSPRATIIHHYMAPCTVAHTLLRGGSQQQGRDPANLQIRFTALPQGCSHAPSAGWSPRPLNQCITWGQRGWGDPEANWPRDSLNSLLETHRASQLMGLGAIISSLENNIFLEAEIGFSIIPRTEGLKEGQTPGPGATCPATSSHRAMFTG